MGTTDLSKQNFSAAGLKIAIVASRYNPRICEGLLAGALRELERLGLTQKEIVIHRVPGAFEIPWLAKQLSERGHFDALICLGAVVRGETAHFEFVCEGTTRGLQQAMLETGVPMAFGILTTETLEQALARAGENADNKGVEAAQTAVEMALLKKQIG